jgi:hypothetical protein
MLIVAMIAWVTLACLSHGYGILIYLGLQTVTTGLFMYMFLKTENEEGKE